MQTQVDIAYVPFIERFQPFLLDVKKYDIVEGRPKLAEWIEVLTISTNSLYKIMHTLPVTNLQHEVNINFIGYSVLNYPNDPEEGMEAK